ncbi:hypothetical protein SAMN04488057_112115 [Cyclobacterium lianum]|uniref:Uncharacterized protein n=1 Tax=Cyclobacterium lianum TaxID=388280 RepID=A0A1M7Q015_9BACT|nr:hypothetical protein [Cyclobacterium lianum]SHN23420.1 hypothetical protein SAMN04488057_112115 [Cyclobacterium lianum]
MLEDLQKHLNRLMNEQNNRPVPEFEGYSPAEMHSIFHFTFERSSPISLQKLDAADYRKIPLLNQVKYLATLIEDKGELKLTKLGFLPLNVVADIYDQDLIKDKYFELRSPKQLREADVPAITLSRILLIIVGLVKKRSNKLSLTKQGQKIIQNDDALTRLIIRTYGEKFNWAFFDGFGENGIGQMGFGFSLILVSRYGQDWKKGSFYTQKYFKAFPDLLNVPDPPYTNTIDHCENCFSYRVFENFMRYFGLVEVKYEGELWKNNLVVLKTDLFDKLISVEKPGKEK